MFPVPDFGVPMTPEEEAAKAAQCHAFWGGILSNGEYAATRYFLQFARTLAMRLERQADQQPLVLRRVPGPCSDPFRLLTGYSFCQLRDSPEHLAHFKLLAALVP